MLAVLRTLLLVAPGILLAVFAVIQIRDGMARDAAIPVPVYMVADIGLPKAAYVSAAEALSHADRRNGRAMIAEAEARLHVGDQPDEVARLLVLGLEHQPVSARGWTLLAEAQYPTQKQSSARALSQALTLAPREYFLVRKRVELAALMWPDLDAESQAMALGQARLLWNEPKLHGQLKQVLQSSGGAGLLSRAFEPDQIRAINRWYRLELQRSIKQ